MKKFVMAPTLYASVDIITDLLIPVYADGGVVFEGDQNRDGHY